MDKNKIFITIASVAGLFVFMVAAYLMTSRSQQPEEAVALLQTIPAGAQTKWAKDGKHTLIKFSDYQCPACAFAHDFVKGLDSDPDITGNIKFVYMHFPLIGIHPFANDAAFAAEAAGKQGKFFEMSDMIFENQQTWSSGGDAKGTFRKYAEDLGLNMEQYDTDVASNEIKTKVAEDAARGAQAGVNGTPTFFLDGRRVNVRSYDAFRKLLKETAAQK
ncbi:MAG: DsbA family protein [Patescibacteria group bacterium]|nr:DsbA family protein [Patescibacteria group bacterium]